MPLDELTEIYYRGVRLRDAPEEFGNANTAQNRAAEAGNLLPNSRHLAPYPDKAKLYSDVVSLFTGLQKKWAYDISLNDQLILSLQKGSLVALGYKKSELDDGVKVAPIIIAREVWLNGKPEIEKSTVAWAALQFVDIRVVRKKVLTPALPPALSEHKKSGRPSYEDQILKAFNELVKEGAFGDYTGRFGNYTTVIQERVARNMKVNSFKGFGVKAIEKHCSPLYTARRQRL